MFIIFLNIIFGEEGGGQTRRCGQTRHDPNLRFSDAKRGYGILSALPLGLAGLHCQGSKSK